MKISELFYKPINENNNNLRVDIFYHSLESIEESYLLSRLQLVPLHHKSEKWTSNKLVEKNKQIRMAAAKKTIEKLEKKDK